MAERKVYLLFYQFNSISFRISSDCLFLQKGMPHYYCPCGYRFDRVSDGRACRSLHLRLFMSIRTMENVSSDSKICGSCRGNYYTWKKKNPELEQVLSRIDGEESEVCPNEDFEGLISHHLSSSFVLSLL